MSLQIVLNIAIKLTQPSCHHERARGISSISHYFHCPARSKNGSVLISNFLSYDRLNHRLFFDCKHFLWLRCKVSFSLHFLVQYLVRMVVNHDLNTIKSVKRDEFDLLQKFLPVIDIFYNCWQKSLATYRRYDAVHIGFVSMFLELLATYVEPFHLSNQIKSKEELSIFSSS